MPWSKKWIETHPEQFRLARNGRVHRYRSTIKGKYHASQFTAKKRGIEFGLTMEEFASLVEADQCHWCLGPLPKTRAGLDRVDNSRGYVMGNCVPCCWICNVMKGKMTSEEFLDRCATIVRVARERASANA